jgi:hypothetical protein
VALLAAQSADQRGTLQTRYDPLADDALHSLGSDQNRGSGTDGTDDTSSSNSNNNNNNNNNNSNSRSDASNDFFFEALLALLLARTCANAVATWHAAAFAVRE